MSKKLIWEILIVVGLVVLAAGFRFYDLANYPGGLFPDEAANGEDALLILDGDARAFYPRGNGREALYYYLQAGIIQVFGVGVWQLHAASALVGVLTVLALYFAVRPFFGRKAAAFSALFLATSYWHVTLSRTGFRAILIPLMVAAFTAFVGSTIIAAKKNKKTASIIYAALAGAMFAGGFYTYIAYRVMVGVIVGIFGLLVLAAIHPKIGFPHAKRYGVQTLVAIGMAVLVFAPLGWYFIEHPKDFIGRAGQVSVFNTELQQKYGNGTLQGTIWYSTRETVRSFFVPPGDVNWRHNVSGYPLLNPIVGFLFILGIIWMLKGVWDVAKNIVKGNEIHLGMIYPYILLVMLGMILPIITTAEGIPHGLRSVGLILPIFMLAGTAGAVLVHWIQRKVTGYARTMVYGALVGLVVLFSVYDGVLYFVVSRNDSRAAYAYRSDLTVVSDYLNEYAARSPDGPRPYLVLDPFSIQTVHFLTSVAAHEYVKDEKTPHPDEPQHKWIYAKPEASEFSPLQPGDIIIYTQSTFPDADRLEARYGEAVEIISSQRNRFNQEIMRVYTLRQVQGAIDYSLDAQ